MSLRLNVGLSGSVVSVSPGLKVFSGQIESLTPVLQQRIVSLDPTKMQAANASAALAITSPDSSGQVVEPAVAYFDAGWNGHRYWGLITGYTGGDSTLENPALYYSDDGQTFTPRPGVAFPIVGTPAGGNNFDPTIAFGPDPAGGITPVLHLTWGSRNSSTHHMDVWWATYDGTTLSTPVSIWSSTETTEAPNGWEFIWDGANNQWVWIYIDAANVYLNNGSATTLKRRTIAGYRLDGTMSAATTCTIGGVGSTRQLWEMHIARRGAQMCMLTTFADKNTGGSNTDLHFGTSDDNGVTWTFNSTALLAASASGWDNGMVYRGCLVPLEDSSGSLFQAWYSARNSGTTWKMGRTTITAPLPVSLSGVAVSGTPATGQVLTATDATDAHWADPSATAGYPSLVQCDMRPMRSDSVSRTGTWALGGDNTASPIYLFNSTAAQNDAIAIPLLLQAGTWTCVLSFLATTNVGIVTVQINGVSVGTIDTYNASALGQSLAITGIVIAATALYTVNLLVASKNASSSGFRVNLQTVSFRKTA